MPRGSCVPCPVPVAVVVHVSRCPIWRNWRGDRRFGSPAQAENYKPPTASTAVVTPSYVGGKLTRNAASEGAPSAGVKTLRLIRPGDRNLDTAQSLGLHRETAIDGKSVGARRLWMGFARMDPGVTCASHHHGNSESGVYLLRGECRFQFGEHLEQSIDARQGDFVYVPPFAIHQEVNLSSENPAEFIVVRDSSKNIVVPIRS